MADLCGDFCANNDVKRVFITALIRPQRGVYAVMIGDGDDIQLRMLRDMIQHFAHGVHTIAGGGVYVQVCTPVVRRLQPSAPLTL